jgi:hypothetical protein
MNCRVFPLDERDLAERDMIMPGQPCGFYFEGRTTGAAAHETSS